MNVTLSYILFGNFNRKVIIFCYHTCVKLKWFFAGHLKCNGNINDLYLKHFLYQLFSFTLFIVSFHVALFLLYLLFLWFHETVATNYQTKTTLFDNKTGWKLEYLAKPNTTIFEQEYQSFSYFCERYLKNNQICFVKV